MKSRKQIEDEIRGEGADPGYSSGQVLERLKIELLLDLREQNEEIIILLEGIRDK